MEKLLTSLIIVGGILGLVYFSPPTDSQVLGAETTPDKQQTLDAPQPIHTTSRFETKLETKTEVIEKEIVSKNDDEMELGEEKTVQEGKDGKKTKVYKVDYYEGKEYSRELISTEVEKPEDKIVLKGTKIVWRDITIDGEQIHYWRKMRVWATHYDSHCPGCNEWTATGMKQGKGVIAVDPSVIKLRSKLYVPGYGQAIAGDTGGAIKGNIIDLGFDDARTAGWSAHFVDIYLE